MVQQNSLYICRLRACLRFLTPFLYVCLILSLTWYETSFSTSIGVTSAPAAAIGHADSYNGATVSQGKASHRLPSVLTPALKLPSSTRLRPENRDDDLSPSQSCWAVAGDPPCLSALRIDPVAWDSRTPSFLLPSAYGLVPFALPPPFRLA